MRFKIGDQVRVVKTGAIGWEAADWCEHAGLGIGDIVTVSKTDYTPDEPSIKVEEDYIGFEIHPDHFELVE